MPKAGSFCPVLRAGALGAAGRGPAGAVPQDVPAATGSARCHCLHPPPVIFSGDWLFLVGIGRSPVSLARPLRGPGGSSPLLPMFPPGDGCFPSLRLLRCQLCEPYSFNTAVVRVSPGNLHMGSWGVFGQSLTCVSVEGFEVGSLFFTKCVNRHRRGCRSALLGALDGEVLML